MILFMINDGNEPEDLNENCGVKKKEKKIADDFQWLIVYNFHMTT